MSTKFYTPDEDSFHPERSQRIGFPDVKGRVSIFNY